MKGIVQEKIEVFLSEDQNPLSGAYGSYDAEDFKSLVKVMMGTDEDFVIFANGGGNTFDIWFNREGFTITLTDGTTKDILPLRVSHLVDHVSGYVYGYQIEGKQTWLKDLPMYYNTKK